MPHLDLFELIKAFGYIGLFATVFAETGLLIGFFLPGDSLLFTAGILASQGYLNIFWLLVVLGAAAVIGDSVGYFIGNRLGPKIFSREESLLFNKKHLSRAQHFFDKHGPKTIIIARFVPVVRTFVPVLAGVGKMHYTKFLSYNVIGGIVWVGLITILGYYLGLTVPNIEAYIIPGIVLIILISISPYLKHFFSDAKLRGQTYAVFKTTWHKVLGRK
jgi:membrane-associated protein